MLGGIPNPYNKEPMPSSSRFAILEEDLDSTSHSEHEFEPADHHARSQPCCRSTPLVTSQIKTKRPNVQTQNFTTLVDNNILSDMESRYSGSQDQILPSSSHARHQSKQAAVATKYIMVTSSCIDKEIRREVLVHQSVLPSSPPSYINALGEVHHQDPPYGILSGTDEDMILATEIKAEGEGCL